MSSNSSPYASRTSSPRKHSSRGSLQGLSLRFEPFTNTITAQLADCVGVGGGAWLPRNGEAMEASPPVTPRTFWLPTRPLDSPHDKESLLQEITQLKAVSDSQACELLNRRLHLLTVEDQNRKLQQNLEELELQGADARRTGGLERLQARFQGMQRRVKELHALCEQQRSELCSLRKDFRLTRTRETEVERNIYADEVIRLLKYIKRVKFWQNRLSLENKGLPVLKDRTVLLEISNKRLESCLVEMEKNARQARHEAAIYKKQASMDFEGIDKNKGHMLQAVTAALKAKVKLECREKRRWLGRASWLESKVRQASRELREVEAENAKYGIFPPPPPVTPKGKEKKKAQQKETPKTPRSNVTDSPKLTPKSTPREEKSRERKGKGRKKGRKEYEEKKRKAKQRCAWF